MNTYTPPKTKFAATQNTPSLDKWCNPQRNELTQVQTRVLLLLKEGKPRAAWELELAGCVDVPGVVAELIARGYPIEQASVFYRLEVD